MTITIENIIDDIKSDKYYYFLQHFPSLKSVFDDIKKSENTLDSIVKLNKLKTFPNSILKLKNIYGKDTIFQLDRIQEVTTVKKNVEVIYVDEDKYEEWFKTFINNDKQINILNVCYNSNLKQYVVSTVYIILKRR